LDTLDPAKLVSEQGAVRNHTLYVICRSGSRASVACERLAAAGFAQVVSIEGGTLACEKAGLPMVRGKKAMSLERQVRICAGFLTLVGALLGFVNPWFLLIPAGVGAGLMYAGITDSCAMGILLAKMPWNKRGAS
jgi:rhodanese-related sulfurtransferase